MDVTNKYFNGKKTCAVVGGEKQKSVFNNNDWKFI